MTQRNLAPVGLLFAALAAAALACNRASDAESAATGTAAAEMTQVALQPSETPPPSVTASLTSGPSDTPAPTETATVQHLATPANPSGAERFLTDASSAAYAPEKRAVGDDYSLNRLERPFTSSEMAYQPHLDIVRAELDAAGAWIYITIILEGAPPADTGALYGTELDEDGDGDGDWLIMAQAPRTSEWTAAGVTVLHDANDDVGGSEPMQAEPPTGLGDGYEQTVFDAGSGIDPDAAWVRRSPSSPTQVQLAFKRGLAGTTEFLWGVWTDDGPQNPTWFDYNDHFTPLQAGSPLINSPNYPLADLAGVDNTCRDAFGFPTTGLEPGLCVIRGAISGVVWKDRCLLTGGEGGEPLVLGRGCQGTARNWTSDGIYEPSWEPGIAGIVVDLGSGSCPSIGLSTTATDTAGRFSFNGLSAGSYCVSVDVFQHGNSASLIPGGWRVPETGAPLAQFEINLLAGENRSGVNFGWLFQFGD